MPVGHCVWPLRETEMNNGQSEIVLKSGTKKMESQGQIKEPDTLNRGILGRRR